MSVKIWIYIERIEPNALGLLHKLQSLGENKEKVISAVIPMDCDPAPVIFGSVQKIYRLLGKGDERQTAGQITALCKEHNPDVMVFLATVSGRNIAAMTAAELKTGLSADCTNIALRHNNILVQTRPAFGGSIFADIICEHQRPQIATVRPGIFLSRNNFFSEGGANSEIIDVPESESEAFTCLLKVMNTGLRPLSAAKIVFSGGRGLGSAEGMRLLEKLAALTGAAVGASRAAVSAGYAQYGYQVGLTGQIIRPDVYVAFGISGAMQHLVGTEEAETIIAVNNDRKAPIFEYADIGIVSDWKPIVQSLIKALEKVRVQRLSPHA